MFFLKFQKKTYKKKHTILKKKSEKSLELKKYIYIRKK